DNLAISHGDKAALSRTMAESVDTKTGKPPIRKLTHHDKNADQGYVIVFDPVLHLSQHIEVKGQPARESQLLSFVMTRNHTPAETVQMRPGPLQMTLENRSNVRTLPGIWVVSDKVHDLVNKRRPFLTAKRLLT